MFLIVGDKTEFTQWEQGQMLTNEHMSVGDRVLFRNAGGKTIPVDARTQDGTVVVDVPNDLLMNHTPIVVDLDGQPGCRTTFKVNKCDCPAGYSPKKNEHRVACNATDWNQNDPSAPDYVKNRTHYVEEVETVLCEWNDLSLGRQGNKYALNKMEAIPFIPVAGEEYVVWYNGKRYVCVADRLCGSENFVDLGNLHIANEEAHPIDTGEPFLIHIVAENGWYAIWSTSDAEIKNLRISKVTETVHKLDAKYLPDGVDEGGGATAAIRKLSEFAEMVEEQYDLNAFYYNLHIHWDKLPIEPCIIFNDVRKKFDHVYFVMNGEIKNTRSETDSDYAVFPENTPGLITWAGDALLFSNWGICRDNGATAGFKFYALNRMSIAFTAKDFSFA